MNQLSIDTVWGSFMLYLFLALCSMATPTHQAATFDTSLFSAMSKKSSCPPDAIRRAMMCTSRLNPLRMSQGSASQTAVTTKALQDGCVQGDFFDAINCIERVMLDCRHDTTDGAHFLRSNFDVENARRSIVYFCTNLKAYVSNLDCISSSLQSMSECGHEAKSKFAAQAGATANKDALLRFQCPFYKTAVTCNKSVLKARCNNEIADISFNVLAGFEPPICLKSKYSVNAGRQQQEAGITAGSGADSVTVTTQWCLYLVSLLVLGRVGVVRW